MKFSPLLILFIVAACAAAPKTPAEIWAENVSKMFGTAEVGVTPLMQIGFGGGTDFTPFHHPFSADATVFKIDPSPTVWYYLERVISPTSASYTNVFFWTMMYTNITFTIKNGVMTASLLSKDNDSVGPNTITNATHTVTKK